MSIKSNLERITARARESNPYHTAGIVIGYGDRSGRRAEVGGENDEGGVYKVVEVTVDVVRGRGKVGIVEEDRGAPAKHLRLALKRQISLRLVYEECAAGVGYVRASEGDTFRPIML